MQRLGAGWMELNEVDLFVCVVLGHSDTLRGYSAGDWSVQIQEGFILAGSAVPQWVSVSWTIINSQGWKWSQHWSTKAAVPLTSTRGASSESANQSSKCSHCCLLLDDKHQRVHFKCRQSRGNILVMVFASLLKILVIGCFLAFIGTAGNKE